jgi:HlyD family secretion protein
MKKRLIIAGVLLAAGIVAVLVHRFGNTRDQGAITVSGNVEVTEVNVGFKISGRVMSLLTDEGRVVSKGEKIASLDSAEYESQAAQNSAALRNAEAQLEKAKKDHERSEMLYKKEVISSQQMDSAKTTYDVALTQVQQAGAALRTAEVKLRIRRSTRRYRAWCSERT